MRLAGGLHLIASGRLGVSLTDPRDCNAYAVECGGRYLLIDAGVGRGTAAILDQLREDGIDPARVCGILLTHYHLDHAGGAALLHEELGAPVIAGAETARAVECGDEEAISLAAAKRAGIYPEDFPFRPCPVARVLADGEAWHEGGVSIHAFWTPGHSRDMMTFRVEREGHTLLFPGDTLFHGGAVSLQSTHDCDPPAYAASLRRIAAMSFDAMFPGHGLWSLSDAHRHAEKAMQSVSRLLLPLNL